MNENDHKHELIEILQNANPYFICGRNPTLENYKTLVCLRLDKEDIARLLDALGVKMKEEVA